MGTRGTTAVAVLVVAALAGCTGGGEASPARTGSLASAAAQATSAAGTGVAAATPAPPASPTPTTTPVPAAADSAETIRGGVVPQVPAPADPEQARLVGHGYEFRLVGSGPVDSLTVGADTRVAAPGQRLHLVRYALALSDPSQQDPALPAVSEAPDAAAAVGGRRIPVALVADEAEAAALLSVPADAGPVALEVGGASSPPRQSLDLATGTRLPGGPTVLYRPGAPESLSAALSVSEQLPFTQSIAAGGVPTEFQLPVSASSARLAWALPAGGTQLRTPRSPDRAFLVLAVEDGGGAYVTPPASAWRLRYPGGPGGGAPATELPKASAFGAGRSVAWEVPGDLTEATATLAPGTFTLKGARYAFGTARVAVPLSFPAGG